MNETIKTSIFIAVAFALFVIAILVQPRAPEVAPEGMVGKTLLENFTDPLAIKGLQIVKYDSQLGEATHFQIAEVNGKWCIPSFQNYPADAREQMANVAADFNDKKVLTVAFSDDAGKTNVREAHTLYGVIDPSATNILSAEDAGIKATFTGDSEKNLANLIIGKEVVDNPNQRYVRIPEQNSVYTMEITTSHLSTKFDDWIEKNLLEISSFDFRGIQIDDYDIDIHPLTGEMLPRIHGKLVLHYDAMSTGAKWKLIQFARANPETNKTEERTIASDESLDEEKLDQMRRAFDDLKIVDVQRKPENLAKNLRENLPLENVMGEPILQRAGFHPAQIHKKDGSTEIKLISNQGGLRIQMNDGVSYQLNFGDLTGTQSTTEETETEAASVGINRYLLVVAEFDESLLEKPEYQILPEVSTEGEPADIEKAQKDREALEKENKRLEAAYQQKVDDARKKVKDLNAKFSDWFYVISEDVFKKLHLTDTDLIKKTGTATNKESALPKGEFLESMMPMIESSPKEETSPVEENAVEESDVLTTE